MKIFKFPNRTYKNSKGEYIKKLYPFDKRYTLLKPIIMKKIELFSHMYIQSVFTFNNITGFYFDIRFTDHMMGLHYSYFFYPYNNYHITYYNLRAEPWVYIKTIIYEGEEERVEKKGVKGKHSKKVKRKK